MSEMEIRATGGWQTKQRLTLLPVSARTTGGWQTKQRLTLLPVLVNIVSVTDDLKLIREGCTRIPRTWACACRSLIRVCPCDRSLLQGNYAPDVSGGRLFFSQSATPYGVLRRLTCLTCDEDSISQTCISQFCAGAQRIASDVLGFGMFSLGRMASEGWQTKQRLTRLPVLVDNSSTKWYLMIRQRGVI